MKVSKRFLRTITGSAILVVLTTGASLLGWSLPQGLPDPFHAEIPGQVWKIDVRANHASGAVATGLPAGRYTVVASGSWFWGPGDRIADAECASLKYSGYPDVWSPMAEVYPSVSTAGDWLDLYLDNKPIDWTPVTHALGSTPAKGVAAKASGCDERADTSKHQYWTTLDWRGGDLNLKLKESNYADNSGGLEVVLTKARPRVNEDLLAVLEVPANSHTGIYTPALLVGQTYRLEASGVYGHSLDPTAKADPECWREGASNWTFQKFPAPYGDDVLDLALEDGTPNSGADGNVAWMPVYPEPGNTTAGSCTTDSNRTYEASYTAKDPQFYPGPRNITQLNLKVIDTWGGYFDNTGFLLVKLFHVNMTPNMTVSADNPTATIGSATAAVDAASKPLTRSAPSAPQGPSPTSGGCVVVSGACLGLELNVGAIGGANTPALPPGKYMIEAKGVYNYYPGSSLAVADPECTKGLLLVTPDVTWQRNRYPYHGPAGSDALDLYVGGKPQEWRGRSHQTPIACEDSSDPNQHVYYLEYTWGGSSTGASAPINFSIFDPGIYPNKSGTLSIRFFNTPVNEQLVGIVSVESADPAGSISPVLTVGKQYRFEASGVYDYYGYGGTGFESDVECTSKGDTTYPAGAYANSPGWVPHRFDDLYGGDPEDVYINFPDRTLWNNGAPIKWKPVYPDAGHSTPFGVEYCSADPSHTYEYTFTPDRNTAILFRVFEAQPYWYTDNVGRLTIKIYARP